MPGNFSPKRFVSVYELFAPICNTFSWPLNDLHTRIATIPLETEEEEAPARFGVAKGIGGDHIVCKPITLRSIRHSGSMLLMLYTCIENIRSSSANAFLNPQNPCVRIITAVRSRICFMYAHSSGARKPFGITNATTTSGIEGNVLACLCWGWTVILVKKERGGKLAEDYLCIIYI